MARKHLLIFALSAPIAAFIAYFGLSQVNLFNHQHTMVVVGILTNLHLTTGAAPHPVSRDGCGHASLRGDVPLRFHGTCPRRDHAQPRCSGLEITALRTPAVGRWSPLTLCVQCPSLSLVTCVCVLLPSRKLSSVKLLAWLLDHMNSSYHSSRSATRDLLRTWEDIMTSPFCVATSIIAPSKPMFRTAVVRGDGCHGNKATQELYTPLHAWVCAGKTVAMEIQG